MVPIVQPLERVVTELVRHLTEEEALEFLLEHFPGAVVYDEGSTWNERRAA
jgi:hypothetical protein